MVTPLVPSRPLVPTPSRPVVVTPLVPTAAPVPFTPAASSVPSVPVPAMPLVLVPTPAVPEALLVPLFPLPLLPRLALELEGDFGPPESPLHAAAEARKQPAPAVPSRPERSHVTMKLRSRPNRPVAKRIASATLR